MVESEAAAEAAKRLCETVKYFDKYIRLYTVLKRRLIAVWKISEATYSIQPPPGPPQPPSCNRGSA